MAEYLIQGETLTGIADKIRPLLGLTGTMTPEQMQTNLTTEQANITAALAALAEKGVEVPEGANSNALAGLIAAIEAGGGDFTSGTITFPEDLTVGDEASTGYKIKHGLGKRPTFFAFMMNNPGTYNRTILRLFAYCAYNDFWSNQYRITGNKGAASAFVDLINYRNVSDENETVVYGISSTDIVCPTAYFWIAAAIR